MSGENEFFVRLYFCGSQQGMRQKRQNIQLLYILEGSVVIQTQEREECLQKEDVLVINAGHTCSWGACENPFVCVIEIETESFLKEIGWEKVTIHCDSATDFDVDYSRIRRLIVQLIVEHASDSKRLSLRKKGLFYQLLDEMLHDFALESNPLADADARDDQIDYILQYIGENYQRKLSMSEVAGKVYMSESSFSRYFKRRTGINFLEYLNNVRLQNSVENLLHTDQTMMEIAINNGFSNSSAFSRSFRSTFGMSPSEYKKQRKENGEEAGQPEESLSEYYEENLKSFVEENRGGMADIPLERRIEADVKCFQPYRKIWNEAVNIGAAAELRSGRMQQQVLKLKHELGFRFVRITNILGSEMRVRREGQNDRFSFEIVDEILDFLKTNEILPILDLGDKPRQIMLNDGEQLLDEETEPPFQTIEEYCTLLYAFLKHVVSRYRVEAVEQWIFELWLNPVLQNTGQYDYLTMFSAAAEGIHAFVPGAKIGGAGLELGNMNISLLETWSRLGVRPSFLSVSAFPYKRILSDSGFGERKIKAEHVEDFYFLQNETRRLKEELRKIGWEKIPLVFSEWNLSMSDRNAYNDSCDKAAQMLMNMVALSDEIDMGIYFWASDLNLCYYDEVGAFFGGFGLLSKDGIPKPAYYSFDFLWRQGDFLIQSGNGYLVTSDGKSNWYILLFNYKEFRNNCFARGEDQIAAEDLPYLFSDRKPVAYKIELAGLPVGDYKITSYSIGNAHMSALKSWRRLGARELNTEERDYLQRVSMPRMEVRRFACKEERLHFSETLDAGEIRCLHIFAAK